ncbi:MAG: hypothetical protein Q4C96_11665 [Planctomycetia bacterium]|nr:hypothetical protein [Planctomycetia bacterium]
MNRYFCFIFAFFLAGPFCVFAETPESDDVQNLSGIQKKILKFVTTFELEDPGEIIRVTPQELENFEKEIDRFPEDSREAALKCVSWYKDVHKLFAARVPVTLKDIQTLTETGIEAGFFNASFALCFFNLMSSSPMYHKKTSLSPSEIQELMKSAAAWKPSGKFTQEEQKIYLENLKLALCASQWMEMFEKLKPMKQKELKEKNSELLQGFLREHRTEIESLIDQTVKTMDRMADEKIFSICCVRSDFFTGVGSFLRENNFKEKYFVFQNSVERMVLCSPLRELPVEKREISKQRYLYFCFPPSEWK